MVADASVCRTDHVVGSTKTNTRIAPRSPDQELHLDQPRPLRTKRLLTDPGRGAFSDARSRSDRHGCGYSLSAVCTNTWRAPTRHCRRDVQIIAFVTFILLISLCTGSILPSPNQSPHFQLRTFYNKYSSHLTIVLDTTPHFTSEHPFIKPILLYINHADRMTTDDSPSLLLGVARQHTYIT